MPELRLAAVILAADTQVPPRPRAESVFSMHDGLVIRHVGGLRHLSTSTFWQPIGLWCRLIGNHESARAHRP